MIDADQRLAIVHDLRLPSIDTNRITIEKESVIVPHGMTFTMLQDLLHEMPETQEKREILEIRVMQETLVIRESGTTAEEHHLQRPPILIATFQGRSRISHL